MKSEESYSNGSEPQVADESLNELANGFQSVMLDDFNFSSSNDSLDSGQNATNDSTVEAWWGEYGETFRHSTTITVLLIVAYVAILIIGVVGNGLVVCVVVRSPRMRTVTNLFILNLAVADLLVVLFCLPPTLMSNILIRWVLGWWMCKTVPYIQGVSVCASVYSLVAVSLDRCSAILFPLGGGFTKRKARMIIAVIWILACSLALPWALYFDITIPDPVDHPHMEFCIEMWPDAHHGDLYFFIGNLGLCYVIPLILITVCYLCIWVRVSYRPVPTDSAAALQRVHRKAKMGVLRMLVVVVAVFLFSWAPLYVIFSRLKLNKTPGPWEYKLISIATPIAQWLGSSNSCINPILYAFLNVKFRRAFIDLLPSCCRRQHPCHMSTTKSSILHRPQTSMYNMTTVV